MTTTLPMFCNQCEQTMGGTGCNHSPGICGKDADVHFDLIGNPDRDGGSENRGPVSERALGEVPVRIDPR
mgnify:CR=1 FL=1